MTATDPELYRGFAARVRATVATAPEGSPTAMNDTATTETSKAPAPVPATFLPAPDAPCETHAWCKETGQHIDHFSRRVALDIPGSRATILTASFYTDESAGVPELWWDMGYDNDEEFTSGDQLREQAMKVRAHATRLESLADEYDAVCEDHAGVPDPAPVSAAPVYFPGGLDADGLPKGAARVPANEDGTQILLGAFVCDLGGGEAVLGVSGAVGADLDLAGARRFRADVAAFLPKLDAMIGDLAARTAPVGTAVPEPPKTWRFNNRLTGGKQPMTCMAGCTIKHAEDHKGKQFPDDIHCRFDDGGVELPISASSKPDTRDAIQIITEVRPFSGTAVERLPHIAVEFIDNHFIEGLDPDGVEMLARDLQGRVDALRAAKARLVEIRAEYMGRTR